MRERESIPISADVLAQRHELRAKFRSPEPLSGFVMIQDFLGDAQLREAEAATRVAELATFCGYSPTGDPRDMRDEFFEPVAGYAYVTIHQRPRRPVADLARLKAVFAQPATLKALSELTGLELHEMAYEPVLTGWGPGSFLEAHTDAGPPTRPTRLVISLSLTQGWQPEFGGTTVWAWEGETPLRVAPQSNQAVLFAPSSRTRHWVEPVSQLAPARSRFTWTLYYV